MFFVAINFIRQLVPKILCVTDSSCPAINLITQAGVATGHDWAKVTCRSRLPFICAVKPGVVFCSLLPLVTML